MQAERKLQAGLGALAVVLLGGAIAVGARNGGDGPAGGARAMTGARFASTAAATPAPPRSGLPDVETMVQRLVARLSAAPDDAEGWRMLGWSYAALGRHAEALKAYEKAIALDGAVARFHSGYGEALTGAASGTVTPAARSEFARAVALDPRDFRARYFLGLARQQDGDTRGAYDTWLALLHDAPPDTPWIDDVRTRMAVVPPELGLGAPQGH